jgi:hypothetical protein
MYAAETLKRFPTEKRSVIGNAITNTEMGCRKARDEKKVAANKDDKD